MDVEPYVLFSCSFSIRLQVINTLTNITMSLRLSCATALILLASSVSALVPNETPTVARRQFLSGVAGVAFAAASAQPAFADKAKTGASSPWTGEYDDPNHPSCLRQVKVVGAPLRADGTRSAYPIVEVRGYDSAGAACSEPPPSRDDIWTVKGVLKNNQATLDFSSKGGPKDLVAKYEDGGIVFPDGNKWTKVIPGTPERFPKDMSTLKSKY